MAKLQCDTCPLVYAGMDEGIGEELLYDKKFFAHAWNYMKQIFLLQVSCVVDLLCGLTHN